MQKRVYLDYNASTPLDPYVAEEMTRFLDAYGNPSSIHFEGRQARAAIDEARVTIGKLLSVDHRQIIFTSGGTEANYLAIIGAARANQDKGRHIVTSSIEHSSVLNACQHLQGEGFEITLIKPTHDGMIETAAVREAIREDTILISVMMANNEIGTIQPISEIARVAHERSVLIHVDAVQALGKIPVNLDTVSVDLLSLSAHKIYGPKGVGALYCRSGIELSPLVRGGSQEHGLRAGTENVTAIHGFGVAANLLLQDGLQELRELREKLEFGLSQTSQQILCKNAPRLPNTVCFYSEVWLGESMVIAFDLKGIALSNGSACSSGIIEPSHVILALGYNEQVARSVIRVSFGKFTHESEIDYFLEAVRSLEKIGVRVNS